MFARKGTTVRRARRSVRRPRPTSSPGSSTPRQMALEPELGSDNRAISQGDLSHHRPSTAPTISSTSSLRISLPVCSVFSVLTLLGIFMPMCDTYDYLLRAVFRFYLAGIGMVGFNFFFYFCVVSKFLETFGVDFCFRQCFQFG